MKLLRVVAPHYVAGAVWEKVAGRWECTFAAPIIKWMIGKRPEDIRTFLDKKQKGYSYMWL